jgi:3-methyladenine DNA glycosylase AlkD
MTVAIVLTKLEVLGTEQHCAQNVRHGYIGEQYGVKLGEVRVIAKAIKLNTALGLELWETGFLEARLVAVLIMKPKELSVDQLKMLVQKATYGHLADWVNRYLVKQHPDKELLRVAWLALSAHDEPWLARTAWSLTTERVSKSSNGLDIAGVLKRIDNELATAPEPARWTMNFCLGELGIHHADYRAAAIAIGERVGAYRDYPTSKGCISPFVPLWVEAIVERQNKIQRNTKHDPELTKT